MAVKTPRFTFLSPEIVAAAADAAEARGVSPVATGPGGFVEAYLAANSLDELHDFGPAGDGGITWFDKRLGFLKRHWAQAQHESLWEGAVDTETRQAAVRPTRRALALAVWAWHPEPRRLERYLVRAGYLADG